MPAAYTYPGVYVEEIPSGVRTITGVSTSDTAFIDFFARGPANRATRIRSFADFERVFGGVDRRSEASYAIAQYYLNGGSIAWVIRVESNARAASTTINGGSSGTRTLTIEAASPGVWGNRLRVGIDTNTRDPMLYFNLVVREVVTISGQEQVVNSTIYRTLSMDQSDSRYALSVVNNDGSALVRLVDAGLGELPASTHADVIGNPGGGIFTSLENGNDGDEPGTTAWEAAAANAIIGSPTSRTGLYALDRIAPDIFNLLCVPAAAQLPALAMQRIYSACTTYCIDKRAFLIVDTPFEDTETADEMRTWMGQNETLRSTNSGVYFPAVRVSDPLNENRLRTIGPSGTIAGVFARTDSTRGVWKAPAGTDAQLRGAKLTVQITDLENGDLNPLGINALRNFPIFGNVAWGARTLNGADRQASEWKYIPVRRTALYIEESLYQGLKWVVFEPNDEPLWAQIRLNVGAFMNNLFRQNAFQGQTPREAYFVKCDRETTTQNDIDRGIVNIVVGFAPLKPAEFVVIKLQQIAGQIET
jgi:Bacteriophage tail sheath protein